MPSQAADSGADQSSGFLTTIIRANPFGQALEVSFEYGEYLYEFGENARLTP